MENEKPNYFVLNSHSEVWEDKTKTLFENKGFVNLTPDFSFNLIKKVDIPMRLSSFDNNFAKTEDDLTDPTSLFSFDLDKNNMLYILEKDSKKIRRLSLDSYEQDTTTNTDKLMVDKYIIECKDVVNPKSISVARKHIYVLDNRALCVYAKINYELVKIINFNDDIDIFRITEDEQVVFYSYSDDKTNLYKKNLAWDNDSSQPDTEEYQIIDLPRDIRLDEYQDKTFKNIIDIAINNKLNVLFILTYRSLYVFDFEGKEIVHRITLGDGQREEFYPTCLAIDEENNDVYIGNTTNEDELAFPRKLKIIFLRKEIYEKPELQPIGFQGQSRKLFLTRITKGGKFYRRLLAINFVHEKNRKHIDIDDNEKIDNFRGTRSETNVVATHISCDILEESSIYKIQVPTTLTTKWLDSLDEKTRWHKVTMDHDIPPNTFVQLSYFCSNHKKKPGENEWISGSVNNRNILISDCVGRYLTLKVEMFSLDEKASPRFNKMIVYFSVPTYLQFLPGIYQEDEQSKIFLEKFLCIFQTLFEETESKILSFIKHLDVKATPEEFLPWLSSWISVSFNEGWSSDSKRSFLERAPEIFRKQGTREGLEEIIYIYLLGTGKNGPEKQSQFQQNMQGNDEGENDNIKLKNDYRDGSYFFIIEGKRELNQLFSIFDDRFDINNNSSDIFSYCFYVLLNPLRIDNMKAELVKRIIEKEKPAHTVGIVRRLPEWIFLGRGNFLGINTVIRSRNFFILGKSCLSVDTVLSSEQTSFEIIPDRIGVNVI